MDHSPIFRILPPYKTRDSKCPICLAGFPPPKKKYAFNVLDHADGKMKIMFVGEELAQQILQSANEPKRHWLMRIWIWLTEYWWKIWDR